MKKNIISYVSCVTVFPRSVHSHFSSDDYLFISYYVNYVPWAYDIGYKIKSYNKTIIPLLRTIFNLFVQRSRTSISDCRETSENSPEKKKFIPKNAFSIRYIE